MKSQLVIFFLILFHYSCAQVSSPAMNDSLPPPPNTVRIKAKIISTTETQATLKITTVIGSGQGIINPLSEGQEIVVKLRDDKKKLKAGKDLVADLKEKLGVDASQSSYMLLQFRDL